ncbi:MAG: hypothetical protein ISS63_07565 [Desulfobacteraceae bacterium]|nr:hypothetical protein [Desulfobacteraceae bacterium]
MNTYSIAVQSSLTTWSSRIPVLFQDSKFATFVLVTLAGISGFCLANAGIVELGRVMEGFQWGVLIIYFSMDRFTGLIMEIGITQEVAVRLARLSKGRRLWITFLFALLLFLVSSFLNNLTAVLVVLPILFVLLAAIDLDRSFVTSFFSLLLAISNLGGAATPIGDFPAIIIMKSHLIDFSDYLLRAFPLFSTTALIITAIHLIRIKGDGSYNENEARCIERELGIDFLSMRYQHRKVEWMDLFILGAVLTAMFIGWSLLPTEKFLPELVAVTGLGFAAVLVLPRGVRLDLKYDMEPMIRLAAFLFIAALAKDSGILKTAAETLHLHVHDPIVLLCSIMVMTALLSGLISAGPTAAAMMPVIQFLAAGPLQLQKNWLAVGFAASICAGSSLFLWSATAGFLLLHKVAGAKLQGKDGRRLRWGVTSYFKYGLIHFFVQLLVAIIWIVLCIKLSS